MISPAAQELLDERPAWLRFLQWVAPEKFGPRDRYVCIRIDKERGPVCYFCSESQKTLYSEIPMTGINYERQPAGDYFVKLEFHVQGRLLRYDFQCSKEQVKAIFNYDPTPPRKRKKTKRK